MWSCKHCKNEFSFDTISQKANHTRWCDLNPKRNDTENLKKSQQKHIINKLGNLKNYKVQCFRCESIFEVEEREKQFPSKEKYFCSRSCSNHRGIGIEWSETMNTDLKQYRTICFAHHDKSCVICSESLIVEVHHLDGDHNNNHPTNLIPLCPTHHQYWHSTHRNIIENDILIYHQKFLLEWNNKESN